MHSSSSKSSQTEKNFWKRWKKRTKVSRGSIAWRFLKGIIFIICLTLFFYQSVNFLLVYYKYPTTIKIEFTYPDEFELPAVTFCNSNPVKRSTFCAEYPDLCESPVNITEFCEIYPSVCKDNPTNLVIPKLGFLTNDSFKEVMQSILQIYYNGNTTKEFWEEWAWSIDAGSTKMKPVFIPRPTMFYPCFTQNLLLNSTDKQQKIHLDSGCSQWLINSYQLNPQPSETIFVGTESYVSLSIHSPFVPVNPFVQGNVLQLGHKYDIHIRLEEENLLPSPYVTNCTIYEDLWNKGNPQRPRSQQMCKELCLHNMFEPYKNMTPEFQMLEIPLKLCLDWKCKTSSEDTKILQRCRRDCKPSCRILKYTSTVKKTILGKPKQKEIHDYDAEKDKIEVDIFLKDRQVVVERHVALYDTGHLFSYIGGLMGCWLGVSIWAFAGIAEKVFRRAIQWMERIKRYFKETSQAPPAVFSIHRNNVRNIKIL